MEIQFGDSPISPIKKAKTMATADNVRDLAGKGTVLNPFHGGPLRRPTEVGAGLDEWSPPPEKKKTPADFFKRRQP